MKINFDNFFSRYIFCPWSSDLSSSEQAVCFIASGALALLTAGLVHLGCGIYQLCKKKVSPQPPDKNPLPGQKKTEDAATAITSLKWEDIGRYDANQVGALVDGQDDFLKSDTRDALQDRLNKLLPEKMRFDVMAQKKQLAQPDPFEPFKGEHYEQQTVSRGFCGCHALNNAFGQKIFAHDAYILWLKNWFKEKQGLDDATLAAMGEQDIDMPSEGYPDFLQAQRITLKERAFRQICTLEGADRDKEGALKGYIGQAKRVWLANIGVNDNLYVPSRDGGVNPIAKGHIVCARKDKNGQWWLIDSRRMRKVPLKYLSVLPARLHILVPVE